IQRLFCRSKHRRGIGGARVRLLCRRQRRRVRRLRWRRRRAPVAGRVLPQAKLHIVPFELELSNVVLAHHVEYLLDLVEVHGHYSASSSSRCTWVSSSHPRSVTSTSSSMRTPPKPGRYAPGSIVKTMLGMSVTGGRSARGLPTRGSSMKTEPRPWA